MVKFTLLSCMLLFFISCNDNNCKDPSGTVQKAEANSCTTPDPDPTPEPQPEPQPEPMPDPGDIPTEALTFDARVQLYNFDSKDEQKVYKALEIIKKVVGSAEFRDRVYNFTFKGKKQFNNNRGMTNEEIYQALLDGSETLLPEKDNEMDLELELYYSWNSTVGYTYPNVLKIWMNTKYFDPYTPAQVAGNVFHEWTHKLGFEHASSYSVDRDSSVPYALGYLIVELGKKYE